MAPPLSKTLDKMVAQQLAGLAAMEAAEKAEEELEKASEARAAWEAKGARPKTPARTATVTRAKRERRRTDRLAAAATYTVQVRKSLVSAIFIYGRSNWPMCIAQQQ